MEIRTMMTAIDTHTEGGPTRIITGGIPPFIEAVNVGPYKGAIPQISGSAYITGFHHFILDKYDPLLSIR